MVYAGLSFAIISFHVSTEQVKSRITRSSQWLNDKRKLVEKGKNNMYEFPPNTTALCHIVLKPNMEGKCLKTS